MKVRLIYFKETGKFYSEGEFDVADRTPAGDIWDHVENLLDERMLPGLIRGHSDYTVLVQFEDPNAGLSLRLVNAKRRP